MDNLTTTQEFIVDESDQGQRLDKFLASLGEIQSRNKAAQLIKENLVFVNGKPAKASSSLNSGDVVTYNLPTSNELGGPIAPYDFPLDIIYEDDDLIVVNKPAGLVVHPSYGHVADTLVNALVHHCKDLSMGFNESRPGIVHRIDRDTSGLLVVAKNDRAHEHLAQQFKNKTTKRTYYCICFGHPKFDQTTLSSYLARHPVNRKKNASLPEGKESSGKHAITHVKKIEDFANGLCLIRCELETGRTHQIRVHLSEKGFPIAGDELYGGVSRAKGLKSTQLRKVIKEMPRFALHAATLGFIHPTNQDELSFSAPWPDDLNSLLPDNFDIESILKAESC